MRRRRSRAATWGMVRCVAAVLVAWVVLMVTPPVGAEYAPFGDAVPMSKLGQMQFHRGQDTTYKRSSPIPQLRCVKGCEFEPAVVQCTNVKPREHKSKWRCETDLPRHLKFDETTIICEGFEYPTDSKVLRGSCGLEYSLTRTGWSPLQSQHLKHYMAIAEEDEVKHGVQIMEECLNCDCGVPDEGLDCELDDSDRGGVVPDPPQLEVFQFCRFLGLVMHGGRDKAAEEALGDNIATKHTPIIIFSTKQDDVEEEVESLVGRA